MAAAERFSVSKVKLAVQGDRKRNKGSALRGMQRWECTCFLWEQRERKRQESMLTNIQRQFPNGLHLLAFMLLGTPPPC